MGGVQIVRPVVSAVVPSVNISKASEFVDVVGDAFTGILQVVDEMDHLPVALKKPDRGVIGFADIPAGVHGPGDVAGDAPEAPVLAHLGHLRAEVSTLKRD